MTHTISVLNQTRFRSTR